MSHTAPSPVRRASRTKTAPPEPPARSREIAALIRLAELDAAALEKHDERDALAAAIPPEILEAYDRAL
ncbi:MAG TPA: hypothetical protein VLF95_02410, partial [Vicinamibacteria bacterium]|nr:hypothetical protein [Vicinamibacteria bacterium]